jgi:hypothetical protein
VRKTHAHGIGDGLGLLLLVADVGEAARDAVEELLVLADALEVVSAVANTAIQELGCAIVLW